MTGQNPISRMVEILQKALKLDDGKLDVAFLNKEELLVRVKNAEFGRIRNGLENCIQMNKCSDAVNYLKQIGRMSSESLKIMFFF